MTADAGQQALAAAVIGTAAGEASVEAILAIVREHLEMDVAFIGEFTEGQRVFRHVDAAPGDPGLPVGSGDPFEETYCHRITGGRIGAVIPDARAESELAALAVTDRLGIGAYVGAPVVFSDGRVYGTLCSFSHAPDATLNERDAKFVRAVADLVAERLEQEVIEREAEGRARERVEDVLSTDEPTMVFQPIVDLVTGAIVGYEALARFAVEPVRPPEEWFGDAGRAGLGVELEMKAVREALAQLPRIEGGRYLSVNVSAAGLCSSELLAALAGAPGDRVVVEVTEHDVVEDVAVARTAIRALRELGVRVAIDDVGAGFSGLSRIVDLAPSVVKLDRVIITGVDRDPVRQSLVAAGVRFAETLGGTLIAEGIETEGELAALRAAGVPYGQGYHLGRPAPLP
jgi:EAL domain-containing protein (putative c-di-GMP-specific phosphodiesterase class I)